MHRISPVSYIDYSLAYAAGVFTVLCFAFATYAFRSIDLDASMALLDDEVKVEAARFSTDTDPEFDIFAAGCEGKLNKAECGN